MTTNELSAFEKATLRAKEDLAGFQEAFSIVENKLRPLLKLTKIIPKHTKTVKFLWCHKNWLQMSDNYRKIRAEMKNPMDHCYWCKHEFLNGDWMALACPEKGSNKVLCEICADTLLTSNTMV